MRPSESLLKTIALLISGVLVLYIIFQMLAGGGSPIDMFNGIADFLQSIVLFASFTLTMLLS
jgi:hypothetical protein